MGSGYFGEPSLGNERGSASSSSSSPSSRRGKKGGSDKQPRQPQRGLGVAQLEKIRLHGEIASAGFHPTSYTFTNDQDVARMQMGYASVPSSTSSSPSYGFPSNIMMGFGEYERRSLRDGDSQYSTAARWDPSNSNGGILDSQNFAQPNMTCYLQNPQAEWTQSRKSKRQERSETMAQNSEGCESQELDLELRLSII